MLKIRERALKIAKGVLGLASLSLFAAAAITIFEEALDWLETGQWITTSTYARFPMKETIASLEDWEVIQNLVTLITELPLWGLYLLGGILLGIGAVVISAQIEGND